MKKLSVLLSIVIVISLFGCSKQADSTQSTTSAAAQSAEASIVSDNDMFSDRDLDYTYDESSAIKIKLNNTNIECDSDTVNISGETATINAEGTYIISGSLDNGQIVIDIDKSEKVQLVLDNAGITCDTSAALYVKSADKVFITLAEGSENTLTNKSDYVSIDDNNIDSVIFSKDDITLNGLGTLTVNANFGHGIACKNDLKITSGTYIITAKENAIKANDSIRIADGSVSLKCDEDGLHSENNDENADETDGFVYIKGGTISIAAGDDGIHAGKNLTVCGGTIKITESYEGLEGQTITVSGGDIDINSDDDGLNASSGSSDSSLNAAENSMDSDSSAVITISGGRVKIDAEGDGVDSNGTIIVTGGETYVDGPTSGGNAAVDYGISATISGGIFVAVGSIGMAENFSADSTQGVMLVNISGSANTALSLKDDSENEILSYTPQKSYQCALISCPEIVEGESYTLSAGSQSAAVEMTSIVYGSSAMGAEMQGGAMQRGFGR